MNNYFEMALLMARAWPKSEEMSMFLEDIFIIAKSLEKDTTTVEGECHELV